MTASPNFDDRPRSGSWPVFLWTTIPLFFLYGSTAARTVTGEDSGELITAAHQLAVAHPPGYPLWLVVTKAFQLFFGGVSVAHASNLASGVTTAVACGLLAVLCLRLRTGRPLAVATGIFVGATHEIWNHATITEVYPLALLFFVASILLFDRWRESPTPRRFFALTLALGAGVSHHPLLLLFGPVFAGAALIAHPKELLRPRSVAICLAGLALPFLAYAQAYYAATQEPALSWGLKPTLASLFGHWNRDAYGGETPKTPITVAKILAQTAAFARFHVENFSLPGVLVGLAGLFGLLRKGGFLGRMTVALYATGTIGLLSLLRFDLEREEAFASRVFLMPAYLALAVGVGFAARYAIERAKDAFRPGLFAATPFASAAIVLALYAPHDRSNYYVAEDYGRAILDGCPKNALLFPGGDASTFPLLYLKYVEGVRKDVAVLDRSGSVEREEAVALLPDDAKQAGQVARREEMLALLAKKSGRPVISLRPERADEQLKAVACGMGFLLIGTGDKASEEAADKIQREFVAGLKLRNESQATVEDYTSDLVRSHLAQVRAADAFRRGSPKAAIEFCDMAVAAAAGVKETHNNVGSLLADHGETERAVERFKAALSIRGDYAIARRNLVVVLRTLGRVKEAMAECARGAAIEPRDPFYFKEGVDVAFETNDGQAVKKFCAHRIAAAPLDPEPHKRLGDWALEQERSTMAARAHYEAALALDSSDEKLRMKLDELPADDATPSFPVPEGQVARPFSAAEIAKSGLRRGPFERAYPRSPKFRRDDEQGGRAHLPGIEDIESLQARLTGAGWTDPAAGLPLPNTNGDDR